jgi:hypothetical protein
MRPRILDHAIRKNLVLESDKYWAIQELIKSGRLPVRTLSEWVRDKINKELLNWR